MLVLGLTALGILVVDALQVPPEPEPVAEDWIEVRFGANPSAREVPVHVVREGETLSSIALERLGSAEHAGELARLNGLVDADRLVPGQRLRLR